jgi:anti-sigma B factor antagonist
MRISERQIGDVVVLDLAGPLYGWQAAGAMEDIIRRHCRSGAETIVVNLARVGSIDCGGLGALVDGYNTMRTAGGEMRLAAITKRINDLLVITRLLTVFETFDTVEQALEGRPLPAYCGMLEPGPLSAKSLGTIHAFLRQV